MIAMLVSLLLAQAPAPAAPRQLVIWSGGATRAEAEEALTRYRKREKDFGEHLQLAGGYPRILESAKVEGLKPGFFVVALGVCASEKDPGFVMLDTWEPAVYSRPVQLAESTCPKPADRWEAGGQIWSFATAQRLQVKGAELSALVLARERTEEGGEFETKGWRAWLFLRKGAKVLASQTVESGGDFAIFKSLEARGAALVLVEENTEPSCYGGGEAYEVARVTHTFSVDGARLEETTKDQPLRSGRCGQ